MPLNPVIAGQDYGAYLPGVTRSLLQLLTLVAVMLMPLGMTASPAQAMPAVGHCDDGHGSTPEFPADPLAHCLGCAALPVADAVGVASDARREPPRLIAFAATIEGSDPETATPPPKQS